MNIKLRVKNNDEFYMVISDMVIDDEERRITLDQSLDLIWNHIYNHKKNTYHDLDLNVNSDCVTNILENKFLTISKKEGK